MKGLHRSLKLLHIALLFLVSLPFIYQWGISNLDYALMAEGVGSSFVPLASFLYIFLVIIGCVRRNSPYHLPNTNALLMKILISTLIAPLVTFILLAVKGIPMDKFLLFSEGMTKGMPTVIAIAPIYWSLVPVIIWHLIDKSDREKITQGLTE